MLKKLEPISLKSTHDINERKVQDFIAENPEALGLGNLIYVGRERRQNEGGRLDLLFSDEDETDRYCVEVQLGKTDPSHIIRTIEYWDSERKRNNEYDHIAVIVAEDITNRFFNVISILSNSVPLIAFRMTATRTDGATSILFSKVVDTTSDYFSSFDDDEVELITDRNYWVTKASKETVEVTDKMLALVKEIDPSADLNYNRHYIGVKIDGQPRNFVTFRPKKKFVTIQPKISESEEANNLVEASNLDTLKYDRRSQAYRLKLHPKQYREAKDSLFEILKVAYDEFFS